MKIDNTTQQIIDSIISKMDTYTQLSSMVSGDAVPKNSQQKILDSLRDDIIDQFVCLLESNRFTLETINALIAGIQDKEIDIGLLTYISELHAKIAKKKIEDQKILYTIQEISKLLFGSSGTPSSTAGIFDVINDQKITLLAYRTKHGYKFTFCSTDKIDETLSKILPNIIYDNNVKISNYAYHGDAYFDFCKTYICDKEKMLGSDILIIPPISNLSLTQSCVDENAKQQYKNIYEKIFKFFNNKNVPISFTQTSSCKGNNFSFALSDNIKGDVKIDKLEFSTFNAIGGMLLPNFHSRYVDSAVKCFYNANIDNLVVHFNFPLSRYLLAHSAETALSFSTETISGILEKIEKYDKTDKISVLKKILNSFDFTINIEDADDKKEEKDKKNAFIKFLKMSIDDKQFSANLKYIQKLINDSSSPTAEQINQQFKDWLSSSIDEFTQQNPQNAVSLTEILKNSKFYNEKTMSSALACLEAMEINKNRIQEFMSKHQITEEDLNKANTDIEKKVDDTKEIQEKSTNINDSIAQANNASPIDAMKSFSEMQKNTTYTKEQQQSNNINSNISLKALNDEKNKQETIK